MTDPLDTLRPEVRDALFSVGKRCDAQTFDTLSAELLRLTDERSIAIADLQYHKQLLAVEAELAAVRASQQWRPLETLPPLEVPIWLYEHGDIYIGMRADSGEGWLWSKCYSIPWYNAKDGWTEGDPEEDDDYQPTFWMPLPEPPAERGEG